MDEIPGHPLRQVEELLDKVDLERLGTAATAALSAAAFLRRHPWILVAAGMTAAAVGAWQLTQPRDEPDRASKRLAPGDDGGNGSGQRDAVAP